MSFLLIKTKTNEVFDEFHHGVFSMNTKFISPFSCVAKEGSKHNPIPSCLKLKPSQTSCQRIEGGC